ncbi:M20 aminoacylase family protein [Thalassospira sp.]|uniref:M20 aminoacylase family protein n=1 Tax=Thalassospira sp. TaxID=1912094 RepID=UPI002733CAB8|nr:M20 aminoacylase family protein [Thalassospira sp.]MDP2697369.1 M20 aminoacylase family protein [Thalassospira sp.]
MTVIPPHIACHPRALELAGELTEWRHHLHAHPETAFEEHQTSAFIAEKLTSFGLQVHTGLAGTGVVATLTGNRGPGRRIGLRADMDALDIHETTNLPYASRHPGKMHACGHDGHMTMLLGAARILAENPDFAGTVDFIFQPAEENEGGGRVMVEQGLFDAFPVDAVYGLHNWPGIPVGDMAMQAGPMMASYDVFEIVVEGKGCHAAMPHLGRDPITAAGQILTGLQTIPARNVNPLQSAVISPTWIFGGDTWNVIPSTATIRGTVRTFAAHVQDAVEQRLKDMATHTARAFDCTATITYQRRYPATINDAGATATALDAAQKIVGADHIDTAPEPSMASEDFAFMLEKVPGSYVWMGNGPTDGDCLLHNAAYDFNDDALPVGVSYWIALVQGAAAA